MSALPAYSDLMLQVAPILGYDPSSADRRGVARYRSRGSLKIDFDRGTFADFEAGIAGGVLDSSTLRAKMPVRGLSVRALPHWEAIHSARGGCGRRRTLVHSSGS